MDVCTKAGLAVFALGMTAGVLGLLVLALSLAMAKHVADRVRAQHRELDAYEAVRDATRRRAGSGTSSTEEAAEASPRGEGRPGGRRA